MSSEDRGKGESAERKDIFVGAMGGDLRLFSEMRNAHTSEEVARRASEA